jgi:hypothetical protein
MEIDTGVYENGDGNSMERVNEYNTRRGLIDENE